MRIRVCWWLVTSFCIPGIIANSAGSEDVVAFKPLPFGFGSSKRHRTLMIKNQRSGHYLVGGRQADSCKVVAGSDEVGQCPRNGSHDRGFLWKFYPDGTIKNRKTKGYLHASNGTRSVNSSKYVSGDNGFIWEFMDDGRIRNVGYGNYLCADSWGEIPRDTKVRILDWNDPNNHKSHGPYIGFLWEAVSPFHRESFGFQNERSGNWLVGGRQADSCKVVAGSGEVGQCPLDDSHDDGFQWKFESHGRIKNQKTKMYLVASSDPRSVRLAENIAGDDSFKWEIWNLRIRNVGHRNFLCADSWGEDPLDTKVRILDWRDPSNHKSYGKYIGYEWHRKKVPQNTSSDEDSVLI